MHPAESLEMKVTLDVGEMDSLLFERGNRSLENFRFSWSHLANEKEDRERTEATWFLPEPFSTVTPCYCWRTEGLEPTVTELETGDDPSGPVGPGTFFYLHSFSGR